MGPLPLSPRRHGTPATLSQEIWGPYHSPPGGMGPATLHQEYGTPATLHQEYWTPATLRQETCHSPPGDMPLSTRRHATLRQETCHSPPGDSASYHSPPGENTYHSPPGDKSCYRSLPCKRENLSVDRSCNQ